VRIAQTARKHGITDDDMLHAIRNPQWQLDDDFTMRVGPAQMATYTRSASSAWTPTIP
jgi:hypothetical protein